VESQSRKGLLYAAASWGLGLFLALKKNSSKKPAPGQPKTFVREQGAPPLLLQPTIGESQKQPLPNPAPDIRTSPPRGVWGYLKTTFSEFIDDDCMNMSAAVAYYTVFSLPPLLLIVITIAAVVFGRAAAQGSIQQQIQGLMGGDAAREIETMLRHASEHRSSGITASIIGFVALFVGATGAFVALQEALNHAWQVKPDPRRPGLEGLLVQRLLSFAMVVALGFLLLVSLAATAVLTAMGPLLVNFLPFLSRGLLSHAIEFGVSFGLLTILAAALFKFVPDAVVSWRHVWLGAAGTSALFTIGKTLIAYYLGKSGPTGVYGAAGSLLLIVLWVYYSCLILLFGAEFTQVWARAHGHEIRPKYGAVRATEQDMKEPGVKRKASPRAAA